MTFTKDDLILWGKDKKGTPNEYAEETVDDEE